LQEEINFSRQLRDIVQDVEGEISEGNNRIKRQAFKDGQYPQTIWLNGVNYYFNHNAIRSVFKKAVREWEKDTCINMREDAEGIAAHELGHALGFFHTMSRHDRDSFIKMNIHNVKMSAPDWLDQFTKQTPQTNENYGITYDYGSIMHYGYRR
ncbi:astacin, partial [Ancylostoma duodenale]